jgi:hypothetical protein
MFRASGNPDCLPVGPSGGILLAEEVQFSKCRFKETVFNIKN